MTGPDPIATLIEDHRRFLTRLADFHGEVSEIARAPVATPEASGRVRRFARFLEEEVDRLHGRKEEEGLFPALAAHLPSEAGPVEVLIAEHGTLRTEQATLVRTAERLNQDPEAAEVVPGLLGTESSIRTLLADHIQKEDEILFPMARELLTDGELSEIARCFERIEREGVGGPASGRGGRVRGP